MEAYKTSLYQHIDDHLKTQLAQLCNSSLAEPHRFACNGIVDLFQLLPEQVISKHAPNLDAPHVEFKIGSAEVCNGFSEDLNFNFSLGLTSLTVR